jgi:GT2 family glycosyltransferase
VSEARTSPELKTGKQAAAPPTWGLVICTYRRGEVLLRCLRAAMRQTVLPAEVIVVDASPDWELTRDLAIREVKGVRCEYVHAAAARLPAQRNQGIALATADVLFLIDDDSILYPDCAQEILKVYAADSERKIAAVGAMPVPAPPDEEGVPAQASPTNWITVKTSRWGRMVLRLRHWLAKGFDRGEDSFVPYGGTWPKQSIPASCAGLDLQPAKALNGFRMTFRREVIAHVGFVGMLVGSAPFEDIEASHRASRYGAVVNARRARLCHLAWSSGRLNYFSLGALWVMNAAVLHVLHGQDQKQLERIWRRRTFWGMCFELLKDLLKRRRGFPGFAGIRAGRRMLGKIYATTPQRLERWYPRVQRRVCGWRA